MNIKTLLILAVFIAASCRSNDDDMVESTCNAIEINSDLFNNGITDEFEILEASVTNDCLILLVRYGGGGGEVFGDLVTQEEAVENSTERNLRFLFDDQSPRDALLSETFEYNLIPLQNSNMSSIQFNLEGFADPILYEY
tara:strand:- start:17196 stop:17615 length:420 start_codon:yes stop_codon:yes gene_type:complete